MLESRKRLDATRDTYGGFSRTIAVMIFISKTFSIPEY
jgi:hypothetical protein